MSIIALDIGRKRIGVAVSRSEKVATPVGVWKVSTVAAFVATVQQLADTEKTQLIIVGNSSNSPTMEPWVKGLQPLAIPVTIVDESYSTAEAQQRSGTTQHHADAEAATILLEHYLEDLCYNEA